MVTANLVVDTSVFIKWYRQGEVLADRALMLREAYLVGCNSRYDFRYGR